MPEKDAEIRKVVDSLEPELEDHLMKYIYRIMGNADACGTMLKWHKVLFTKSGLGCIVRNYRPQDSVSVENGENTKASQVFVSAAHALYSTSP